MTFWLFEYFFIFLITFGLFDFLNSLLCCHTDSESRRSKSQKVSNIFWLFDSFNDIFSNIVLIYLVLVNFFNDFLTFWLLLFFLITFWLFDFLTFWIHRSGFHANSESRSYTPLPGGAKGTLEEPRGATRTQEGPSFVDLTFWLATRAKSSKMLRAKQPARDATEKGVACRKIEHVERPRTRTSLR